MSILTNKYLLVGAAVAGLAVAYMMRKTVGVVAEAVNPFNNNNVVNQVATSWYQGITGSTGSIGTDLYDATHGGALSNGTFNPTSTNNILYRNLGGDDWSIGTKIYDWMN